MAMVVAVGMIVVVVVVMDMLCVSFRMITLTRYTSIDFEFLHAASMGSSRVLPRRLGTCMG